MTNFHQNLPWTLERHSQHFDGGSGLAVTLAVLVLVAGCQSSAAPTQTPATSKAEQQPDADVDADESHAATPHAHETHSDAHTHDKGHGSSGYRMDFSDTDRFSRHFDSAERHAWQKPDHVVELMNIEHGDTLVDVGAGTGYFVSHLSRAVGPSGRVIALDVEPNMVEHLKERSDENGWANVEARVVPRDDPKLAPESVDHILIVNTWHHIGQRAQYAKKLVRALEPGGVIYIVDFTKASDIGPPQKHRLTAEEVMAELEPAGLEAQVLSEELPKQYVVRVRGHSE